MISPYLTITSGNMCHQFLKISGHTTMLPFLILPSRKKQGNVGSLHEAPVLQMPFQLRQLFSFWYLHISLTLQRFYRRLHITSQSPDQF